MKSLGIYVATKRNVILQSNPTEHIKCDFTLSSVTVKLSLRPKCREQRLELVSKDLLVQLALREGRQVGRQAGRQTGRQTGRQAGRQEDRQAGRKTGRQAGRQVGRQAGRQAGR